MHGLDPSKGVETMPRKMVFMVDKFENIDGMHHVSWTDNGKLPHEGAKINPKENRGFKKFKGKKEAVAFAKKVGLSLGEGTEIDFDTIGENSLVVKLVLAEKKGR